MHALALMIVISSLMSACGNRMVPPVDKRVKLAKLGDPLNLATSPTTRCAITPKEGQHLALVDSSSNSQQFFERVHADISSKVPASLTGRLSWESDRASYTKTTASTEHGQLRLLWQGVALCRTMVRAHIRQGQVSLSSSFNKVFLDKLSTATPSSPEPWLSGEAEETASLLKSALATANKESLPEPVELVEQEKCWYLKDSRLLRAYAIRYSMAEQAYSAILSQEGLDELSKEEALASVGHIKTFDENPTTGRLEDHEIDHMQGSGFLCSNWFATAGETNQEVSFDSDLTFVFAPTDPRFEEATMFAYASEWADFIESVGGRNWYGSQVLLNLVTDTGPLGGGPQYYPVNNKKNNTGMPMVGMSATSRFNDGSKLTGLRTDADVVRHELSHHLVYETVNRLTSLEALIAHEGWSDILTYMASGDACLGESICNPQAPAGSCRRVAELGNSMCLRSAANPYKYRELLESHPLTIDGAHYPYAEMLSGLFWDTVQATQMSYHDGGRLAYHAIQYLEVPGGFTNMLTALLRADQDLFAGAHACKLIENAQQRQLGAFVEGIDCRDLAATLP